MHPSRTNAIMQLAVSRAGLSVLFLASRAKAKRLRTKRTSGKFAIDADQLNALGNLAPLYLQEARACIEAEAHYAAAIMLGAAFEAIMLLLLGADPSDLQQAVDSLPPKQRPKGHLLTWDLNEFIVMARHLNWLPCRRTTKERQRIGDRVETLREFRNLVHIGRHLREYPRLLLGAPQVRNAERIFEEAIFAIDSCLNPEAARKRSRSRGPERARRSGN